VINRSERQRKSVRCVDLFDLRQGEHDLPSVVDTLRLLTLITFQIDRLELVVLSELWFKIVKIRDLVIIRLSRSESGIRMFVPLERSRRKRTHPKFFEAT
jgi:hypothetical protein